MEFNLKFGISWVYKPAPGDSRDTVTVGIKKDFFSFVYKFVIGSKKIKKIISIDIEEVKVVLFKDKWGITFIERK